MPYCKNCHSRIDKFNKDRCPICGMERPLDDVSSDTIEITTSVDVNDLNLNYHPRHRKTLLIYFLTLGIFGVPFFYLYENKKGIIYSFFNLLILGLMIFLFVYFNVMGVILGILIPILAIYAFNAIIGFIYFRTQNLKDGRGDFLE